MVLVGGHTRATKHLATAAAMSPRPLCRVKVNGEWQPRQNMDTGEVATEVPGVNLRRVQVRQALDDVADGTIRASQILWLLEDLEKEFK